MATVAEKWEGKAKGELIGKILLAAFPNYQFIITTHSPHPNLT